MLRKRELSIKQVFWLIIVMLALHDAMILGYLAASRGRSGRAPQNRAEKKIPASLPDLGPAPDLKLPDLRGRPVDLSKLRGRAVLVDFWGTWCQSCCAEMPVLDRIHRKYKDRGFVLVAVAVEFDRDRARELEAVKRRVAELGISFPVALGDDSAVKSFGGKLENFPQAYLIDGKGRIRAKIIGARPESYWDGLVQSVIGEQ
ncbi:MAG: TlpA family protein disulfide reductase [Bacillota bacterium]